MSLIATKLLQLQKAANKVRMDISEEGLSLFSTYARNGRETVNMMQIAAGLAISEERTDIKMKILNGLFILVNYLQDTIRKLQMRKKWGLLMD